MGRRSDFERIDRDAYQTIDPRAVQMLLPHLRGIKTFAEPCAGDGHLVGALQAAGLLCVYEGDISNGLDALTHPFDEEAVFDAIITNTPWRRDILHPMVDRFMHIAPTWVLLDASWAHTTQRTKPDVQPKTPYLLDRCSHIVSVGRLRWIPETTMKGKDDCAWYRFDAQHSGGPRFIGMEIAA
ncbi:hypothetical protein [Rhizobium laguerreae]|uniref:SAM-dependent methyltransferase n=1 Tax=Rhizobium laguerreae TaxID=1076926 RepID=A0A7Y2RBI5_9HYPH|nr:hypothetical protein [Rhizobium laguerreae]NNH67807.1 hypothetical protein [Rhizobium laguerreae]